MANSATFEHALYALSAPARDFDATVAWQRYRNNLDATVNWQFTTETARIKLRRLYPTLEA